MSGVASAAGIALTTGAVGMILLICSNVMYRRRAGASALRRFWLTRSELASSEYAVNRLGFALVIFSLLVLLVLIVRLSA